MKKSLLPLGAGIVAMGACSVAQGQAQQEARLSLESSIAKAELASNAVQASLAQVRGDRARLSQQGAQMAPTLNSQLQARAVNQELVIAGSQAGASTQNFSNATGTLSLSYPLDLSKSLKYSRSAAQARLEASSSALAAAQNDLRKAVSLAYLRVLKADRLQSLAESSLMLANAQLKDVTTQFSAGKTARLEVERIESLVSQRRAQLSSAQAESRNSRYSFNKTIGETITRPVDLEDLAEDTVPELSYERLLEQALLHRGEVRETKNQSLVSDLSARSEAAKTRPEAQFGVDYQRVAAGEVFFTPRKSLSAFVTISKPLSDGGLAKARVEEQKALERQSQLKAVQAEKDISSDLLIALSEFKAAKERYEESQRQAALSTRVQQATTLKRREGKASLLEVIDADSQVQQAQDNLIISNYDLRTAEVNLRHAVGLPRNTPWTGK
jgi:outer membrane protein TolC